MSDVFNLIFNLFGNIVSFLKRIPLSSGVSLYDFSIGIFVMSVTIVAFVPIVRSGSSNVSVRSRRSKNSKSSDEE